MENETTEKSFEPEKSKKAWVKYVIIGLILAGIVGAAIFFGKDMIINAINSPENINFQEQATTTSAPSNDNKVPLTESNRVYFDGIVRFDTLPKVVGSSDMEEKGRVRIHYKSDKPISFYLYDESHFKQWENGYYGSTKATTGSSEAFSEKTFLIDINNGEGGKYWVVFDDRLVSDKPTQAKLEIIELVKIGE